MDIETGKLEWLVNGYQAWATMSDRWNEVVRSAGETVDKLKTLTDFNIGEMKFPETKIGETVTKAEDWLARKVESFQAMPPQAPPMETSPSTAHNVAEGIVDFAAKHWPKSGEGSLRRPPLPPPKIPVPPPIRVRVNPLKVKK